MKKNLAIIGASYLQLPLIIKAKEMGYKTHVFAWAKNDVGEKEADVFYPISIVEKEKILLKCKEIEICGICSIASDLASITVNYVANAIGLPGNSMECTYRSTNKHLMRETFKENGDPSPISFLVNNDADFDSFNNLEYPIIVKPIDRSGSRGIYKLETPDNLRNAVKLAISESFEKRALIEEFVEGQEYSVEGISYRGEHAILAMTLKSTTGAPHFIETAHMEPAPVSNETYEEVKRIIVHALNSLDIKNGASHSEIKINKSGDIKIIEIGARMGGDCIGSDLVYYSTGIDYVKAVIDVACGKKPSLYGNGSCKSVGVRFIFSNEDIKEMEKIKNENRLIRLVDYRPENIGKTTDSSNRAGCYIYYL